MSSFAAGLAHLGLRRGDKVSLFSENSTRWLIADQGVMMNGAADAVSRAHDSSAKSAARCPAATHLVHGTGTLYPSIGTGCAAICSIV